MFWQTVKDQDCTRVLFLTMAQSNKAILAQIPSFSEEATLEVSINKLRHGGSVFLLPLVWWRSSSHYWPLGMEAPDCSVCAFARSSTIVLAVVIFSFGVGLLLKFRQGQSEWCQLRTDSAILICLIHTTVEVWCLHWEQKRNFWFSEIGLLCTEWWNWVHDISDYISLTNRTCWIFSISLFSLSCFIVWN